MRTIKLAFALLFAALALPGVVFAGESTTTVRAILVIASNEKGGTDPRLAAHEDTLRRVLRVQSFRHAGEGSARVAPNGEASISLPAGNRVQLQGTASGVQVIRGGRPVPLQRGSPVVLLGGQAGNSGEYAIIVTVN